MYDQLLQLDRDIFLILNGDCGNFMDYAMIFFTNKAVLIGAAISTLVYLYKKMMLKDLLFVILGAALIILVADQSCNFFKDFTPRLRPMYEPLIEGNIHLIDGMRGGESGTVSAHAANSFGLLFFFSLIIKKWRYTLLAMVIAAIISYSRIYLGYHYLLDVIYGTSLGLTTGYLVYRLYRLITKRKYE